MFSLTPTAQTERRFPRREATPRTMRACRAHVSGCNGRSEGRTPSLPRPGPSRCAFVWRRVRTTRMHCCFESFRAPRLSCLRAAFACGVWSNALSRVRSCRVCSRVLACARGGGRRKPRTRALLSCYYVPEFNPILLTSSSSIDRELHPEAVFYAMNSRLNQPRGPGGFGDEPLALTEKLTVSNGRFHPHAIEFLL